MCARIDHLKSYTHQYCEFVVAQALRSVILEPAQLTRSENSTNQIP